MDMEVLEDGGVMPLPVVEKVEERWDDDTGESTGRLRDLVFDETDMGPSEMLEADGTARSSAFVFWRFAKWGVGEAGACERCEFEGGAAGVSTSGGRLRLEEVRWGGGSGDSGVSTSISALFSAMSFSIRARR